MITPITVVIYVLIQSVDLRHPRERGAHTEKATDRDRNTEMEAEKKPCPLYNVSCFRCLTHCLWRRCISFLKILPSYDAGIKSE